MNKREFIFCNAHKNPKLVLAFTTSLTIIFSSFLQAWIQELGRSVNTGANLVRAYCEIPLGADLGKRVRNTGKNRVAIRNLGFSALQGPGVTNILQKNTQLLIGFSAL